MEVEIVIGPFSGIYHRWQASAKVPYKSIAFAQWESEPLFSPGFVRVIAYARTKKRAIAKCESKVRDAVERDRKEHQRDMTKVANTSVEKILV